ncbi:sulfatase-like hydrolase/transferase [Pseudomonas aeruginosa]
MAAVQPAAQAAGQRAQQWPTGGRRLARRRPSGHPAGRRRAQPARPFRNAAAGRRRARAQRPDRGHGGNPRRVYRRQPRRHQQQLPRSADAQTEWLGRTGDDHPGLRAAQPPDHPRPLRHALRRLQQARLGHAEGRRAAEQPGPGQGVLARPAAPARFSTHFLQGAGLRFMAKDKVMPQMGFDKTLGRDWFRNTSYLEFPWGMDDKAFFEGAATYVKQLRQQKKPWMLTLLTVGTHQPYSAPADYLARYPSAKQAAVAYLDDAIDAFLADLEKQGVLRDTLVVLTSDESHGVDQVRLASAWGFNLVLAPEQAALPPIKSGVYGHVDLAASVLDYFGYRVPAGISGRSLFRDYASGREMMSYTNGMLRHHDGKDTFVECDFQQVCRRYRSEGFIADEAEFLGRFSGRQARLVSQRAAVLDHSVQQAGQLGQEFQFATHERIRLKPETHNDWTDNLIGAQYLEMPKNSRTTVTLKIRALQMDRNGARVTLKTKEFERDVPIPVPDIPRLLKGKPLDMSFTFDNPEARKAFSFHLLAEGRGIIEISDFHVVTAANPEPVESRSQVAEAAKEQPLLSTLKSLFANRPETEEAERADAPRERTVIPEQKALILSH